MGGTSLQLNTHRHTLKDKNSDPFFPSCFHNILMRILSALSNPPINNSVLPSDYPRRRHVAVRPFILGNNYLGSVPLGVKFPEWIVGDQSITGSGHRSNVLPRQHVVIISGQSEHPVTKWSLPTTLPPTVSLVLVRKYLISYSSKDIDIETTAHCLSWWFHHAQYSRLHSPSAGDCAIIKSGHMVG